MLGVEGALLSDPDQHRADIFNGVLAQQAVVERQVTLAVSRRAAHVGRNDRKAQLIDHILNPGIEAGTELRFRSAVQ